MANKLTSKKLKELIMEVLNERVAPTASDIEDNQRSAIENAIELLQTTLKSNSLPSVKFIEIIENFIEELKNPKSMTQFSFILPEMKPTIIKAVLNIMKDEFLKFYGVYIKLDENETDFAQIIPVLKELQSKLNILMKMDNRKKNLGIGDFLYGLLNKKKNVEFLEVERYLNDNKDNLIFTNEFVEIYNSIKNWRKEFLDGQETGEISISNAEAEDFPLSSGDPSYDFVAEKNSALKKYLDRVLIRMIEDIIELNDEEFNDIKKINESQDSFELSDLEKYFSTLNKDKIKTRGKVKKIINRAINKILKYPTSFSLLRDLLIKRLEKIQTNLKNNSDAKVARDWSNPDFSVTQAKIDKSLPDIGGAYAQSAETRGEVNKELSMVFKNLLPTQNTSLRERLEILGEYSNNGTSEKSDFISSKLAGLTIMKVLNDSYRRAPAAEAGYQLENILALLMGGTRIGGTNTAVDVLVSDEIGSPTDDALSAKSLSNNEITQSRNSLAQDLFNADGTAAVQSITYIVVTKEGPEDADGERSLDADKTQIEQLQIYAINVACPTFKGDASRRSPNIKNNMLTLDVADLQFTNLDGASIPIQAVAVDASNKSWPGGNAPSDAADYRKTVEIPLGNHLEDLKVTTIKIRTEQQFAEDSESWVKDIDDSIQAMYSNLDKLSTHINEYMFDDNVQSAEKAVDNYVDLKANINKSFLAKQEETGEQIRITKFSENKKTQTKSLKDLDKLIERVILNKMLIK